MTDLEVVEYMRRQAEYDDLCREIAEELGSYDANPDDAQIRRATAFLCEHLCDPTDDLLRTVEGERAFMWLLANSVRGNTMAFDEWVGRVLRCLVMDALRSRVESDIEDAQNRLYGDARDGE